MKPPSHDLPDPDDRALKARDGIVAGSKRTRSSAAFGRGQARATWVVVARNDEQFEEFFLESPYGEDACATGEDPVPWICRGVDSDGILHIGAIDLRVDRFLSDVLNDELGAALRKACR